MSNFRTIGSDFSGGIRAAHYTNGRLLTAEDLRHDQQAMLARLAALGEGVGAGVISGFEVSAVSAQSSLRVTPGLGINGEGTVVELAADEAIVLPVQPVTEDEEPLRRAGRFEACLGEGEAPGASLDRGAYLLVAAPLARLEGMVPRRACDGAETATCANQWEVEGVSFKIIRLTAYQPPASNRAARNRNLLAHWFYGSDRLHRLMHDPFQFDPNYSGFNDISAEDLTPCDLPLAAFFWENGRISFVDIWAVRRRPATPFPASTWQANLSDQRVAEGEARFIQFQSQLASLQSNYGAQTASVRAADHFAYLPPVGLLPVNPFQLIVADLFTRTLESNQELGALLEESGLEVEQVLERVRAGVDVAYGNNRVFDLETFFEEMLPERYRLVLEDAVHTRLHQSMVQPALAVPAPSDDDWIFDLIAADSAVTGVDANNFENVLSNLGYYTGTRKKKYGSDIELIAGRSLAGDPAIFTGGGGRESGRNLELVDAILHQPDNANEINVIVQGEEDEEPLVDIWVLRDLLLPYHRRLQKEMENRIEAAIRALSGGGGGRFTSANLYKEVSAEIGNELLLENFVRNAALRGVAHTAELIYKSGKSSAPQFYVVFVRHQPALEQPRLQL